MKMTRYFKEQVLRKRPYIKIEWCERVIERPLRRETQQDNRIKFWGYIPEIGKYLRVITLEDGETIHNCFPDRDFKE